MLGEDEQPAAAVLELGELPPLEALLERVELRLLPLRLGLLRHSDKPFELVKLTGELVHPLGRCRRAGHLVELVLVRVIGVLLAVEVDQPQLGQLALPLGRRERLEHL